MKRDERRIGISTYRYIQLDVSRFGFPVSHSGAKVIQPTVNHVSASYSNTLVPLISTDSERDPQCASQLASHCHALDIRNTGTLVVGSCKLKR
jgi:hypothetical protein